MLNFDYLQNTIDATASTYKKMLSTTVNTHGAYSAKTGLIPVNDITALIGFNGEVIGSMFISMKNDIAMKTISRFMMFEQSEIGEDVFDGLEEIVNIISGAAAANFKAKTCLGLPTILIGENQRIRGNENTPWKLQNLHAMDIGDFTIGVTLKEAQ